MPHRGARVTELSAADIRKAVDARIMLETFAARLALQRLDDASLHAMERQIEAARQATPNVDLVTDFKMALGFHDLFVAACGNPRVVQLYEILRRHARRYQHFAFLNAFRHRVLAAVERLLAAHLRRSSEQIARLLSAGPALDGTPALGERPVDDWIPNPSNAMDGASDAP